MKGQKKHEPESEDPGRDQPGNAPESHFNELNKYNSMATKEISLQIRATVTEDKNALGGYGPSSSTLQMEGDPFDIVQLLVVSMRGLPAFQLIMTTAMVMVNSDLGPPVDFRDQIIT